jgi:RimJ/RimL family protein N-acetyltransferase
VFFRRRPSRGADDGGVMELPPLFCPLDEADSASLQELFEQCSEFFELTEGAPPSSTQAADELASRAPGKNADDTFCFGIHRDDTLIGFIHVTRDHPKPNEWWLGLLLLHPAARRMGLGEETHEALLAWAASNGARVMWLGVLEQNTAAERFWRRIGYVERERQLYGAAQQSTIILMTKGL